MIIQRRCPLFPTQEDAVAVRQACPRSGEWTPAHATYNLFSQSDSQSRLFSLVSTPWLAFVMLPKVVSAIIPINRMGEFIRRVE
eukprot:1997517-Pyramimonas_sp.AAC.1